MPRCYFVPAIFLLTTLFAIFALAWPAFAASPSDTSYLRPIEWTFSDTPAIAPSQLHGIFESKRVSCCSVLQLGDIYRMYYWTEDSQGHYYIAQAESPVKTPHRWIPKGILLERQPEKPHNSQGPCYAQVIPREKGPWLMYFCAWGSPRADGTLPYGTNLALSDDRGATWHYDTDEYIFPHTEWWNKKGTGSVCVIEDNGLFRAYFTSFAEYRDPPEGFDCFHAHVSKKIPHVGIGYAESDDGIHWHYPLDRWVAATRGDLGDGRYEYLFSKPWVIRDGDGYRMWCGTMGSVYRICSFTSPDGLNWTIQDDWVVDDRHDEKQDGVGKPGTFDDYSREYPMVVKQGEEYHLWYTGNWFGQTGDYKTGMGFATGQVRPE